MTIENAKEMKYVVSCLSVGALIVLGSALTEQNILDYFYVLFIISCLIRYIFICKKK